MSARTPYPSGNPINRPIANIIDANSGRIRSCSLVAGEWGLEEGPWVTFCITRGLPPRRRIGSRPGVPDGPHPKEPSRPAHAQWNHAELRPELRLLMGSLRHA